MVPPTDLLALAKRLDQGVVPEADWSAYEAGAEQAWRECSDALVLTHLALRGGAWDGVAAAFAVYAREVEQRLRAQFAGDGEVQASLVSIHYGLDLLRRAVEPHDLATALRLAGSLPDDEALASMTRHVAALLHRFVPAPPSATSLRTPHAPLGPDALMNLPTAWPSAIKALEGPYGEPESPLVALQRFIDDAGYGESPDVDEVLAELDTWAGAGKDGLAAAWEVCDVGDAMCEVLAAVGRLDDALRARCRRIELAGSFAHPERYAYLRGLASATLIRFEGPAAPTMSELREALGRIVAAAASEADE